MVIYIAERFSFNESPSAFSISGGDFIHCDIVNITLHFFLKDVRSMLPPAVNHSIAVS